MTHGLIFFIIPSLCLQPGKPSPPVDPLMVAMIWPWVVNPGQSMKLAVRGQKLGSVQAALLELPGTTLSLAITGKAQDISLPEGMEAKVFGAQNMILEASLPPGLPESRALLTLTDKEKGKGQANLELTAQPLTLEKEPNNDLDQYQSILSLPCRLLGTIEKNQDVDCFCLHVKRGQKIEVRLTARGRGSLLDPLIAIQGLEGTMKRLAGPQSGSQDLILIHQANQSGQVCLVIRDSFDTGGPSHTYDVLISIGK